MLNSFLNKIRYVVYALCIFAAPLDVFALRESQPLSIDSRLRVMVYNPNDVFKFVGFYGYESSVVFASDETIDSITIGDSVPWQIVPNGNRLFIKPIDNDAITNLTVITSKRVYHFELHAKHAKTIEDPDLIFSVKFLYPDDEDGSGSAIQQFDDSVNVDLDIDPDKVNTKYSVSGSDQVLPIKVFDDGEKTYFQFRENAQELPAIFLVNSDRTEGIVNYNISGKYLVVHTVAQRFSLRKGSIVGCVFNDKYKPTESKKDEKNRKIN